MDHLDRMFRQLVRELETSHPAYLTRPFEVGELYQTILPYRHHRRELALDTNQDYEMALTELLSGAGGYLIVDDRMRDALARELSSPNPDPAAFREFSTTQVAISPEALRRLRSEAAPAVAAPAAPAAPASTVAPAPPVPTRPVTGIIDVPSRSSGAAPPPPRPATPIPPASTARPSSGIAFDAGSSCRYCGGALPTGRKITFCPHCGQNVTSVNCPACGTELDAGWKFCTTCGRRNSAAGG